MFILLNYFKETKSNYYIHEGVVVGAHRLFTHRSYEASKTLRLFLLILHNFSGQYSLFEWVRHHRIHHKFSDTDADPHNAKRGFFFSQIGWVFLERTKEFEEKSKLLFNI